MHVVPLILVVYCYEQLEQRILQLQNDLPDELLTAIAALTRPYFLTLFRSVRVCYHCLFISRVPVGVFILHIICLCKLMQRQVITGDTLGRRRKHDSLVKTFEELYEHFQFFQHGIVANTTL